MKKSISVFIPSNRGGGAERTRLNLAQGLSDRGIQVDLVVVRKVGPYRLSEDSKVNWIDIGKGRVIKSLPWLIGYLRRKQPEVLISTMDHANLVSIWARYFARVSTRLVISTHTMMSKAPLAAVPRRERIIPYLAHFFYPWADHVVAISKAVAEDLSHKARLPRGKIRVIYNPIVTSELLQMAQEDLDHPWFRPGKPPVIMGVGRLAQEKNFSLLIRAFKEVQTRMDARLMILGEGKERERLERLIKNCGIGDRVSLPGFNPNPFIYMANAGVVVLSSNWEGLGNVLVESMACGTPVVSTDCPGGPAEILEGGRFGRLVPVEDANALAEGIIAALSSHSDPDLLRKRADDFSVERITQQYLEMIYS